MTLVAIICAYCGKGAMKEAREINRAKRQGMSLYCDRACAGNGRRVILPPSQKIAEKADYDKRRRAKLGEALRAKKRAAYHAALAENPEPIRAAQRAYRSKNMARHVEYCRRPEYRKGKAEYDRKYLARKQFGPFAEAAILLNDLQTEILSRATRYEIDLASGTLNKKLNRRRDYEQAVRS